MEFIPWPAYNFLPLALTLLPIVGFIAVLWYLDSRVVEFSPNTFLLSLVSGILLLTAVVFSYHFSAVLPREQWRNSIAEEIKQTYGEELTKEQIKALDYPTRRPDVDFQIFGSFNRDSSTESGFKRSEVFLLWRAGELRLAESDDKRNFFDLTLAARETDEAEESSSSSKTEKSSPNPADLILKSENDSQQF